MASQPTAQPNDNPTWPDLALPVDTLALLHQIVAALRHAQEPDALDFLRRHSGILLFGPPGTGKTQIARTLQRESGVAFIVAGQADFKQYIGQGGAPARDLFQRARDRAPCILFIDEIDAVFPKPGDPHSGPFSKEAVSLALSEMERAAKNERFILLLAATNLPECVDKDILARFPDAIEIPYPAAQQRQQILQFLLSKTRVDFDVQQVAAELAGITGNLSGRALRNLVEKATMAALERELTSDTEDNVIVTREDLISQLSSKP